MASAICSQTDGDSFSSAVNRQRGSESLPAMAASSIATKVWNFKRKRFPHLLTNYRLAGSHLQQLSVYWPTTIFMSSSLTRIMKPWHWVLRHPTTNSWIRHRVGLHSESESIFRKEWKQAACKEWRRRQSGRMKSYQTRLLLKTRLQDTQSTPAPRHCRRRQALIRSRRWTAPTTQADDRIFRPAQVERMGSIAQQNLWVPVTDISSRHWPKNDFVSVDDNNGSQTHAIQRVGIAFTYPTDRLKRQASRMTSYANRWSRALRRNPTSTSQVSQHPYQGRPQL